MNHLALRFVPLLLLGFLAEVLSVRADDWPQWRGPLRDGVWREDGVLERFPPEGPPVRWRTPIGAGFSGPAVAGGRVFLMDRAVDQGASADVKTHSVLMLEFRPDVAEPRVFWKASASTAPERQWKPAGFNTTMSTVLLLDGHVYGVSLYGETCCLNGETGQRVWTTLQPTSGGTEPRERWRTLFMVPHGDRVFVWNDHGVLILARLTPAGYE